MHRKIRQSLSHSTCVQHNIFRTALAQNTDHIAVPAHILSLRTPRELFNYNLHITHVSSESFARNSVALCITQTLICVVHDMSASIQHQRQSACERYSRNLPIECKLYGAHDNCRPHVNDIIRASLPLNYYTHSSYSRS